MTRGRLACFALLLLAAIHQPAAAALNTRGNSSDRTIVDTTTTRDGARAYADEQEVGNLGQGRDLNGVPFARPMEFQVRMACKVSEAGVVAPGESPTCEKAMAACRSATGPVGVGILYDIYARAVGTQGWNYLASTCFADEAPSGPVLSLPMIVEAFHLTPWATARVATQPEGNVTLVGLKTFFRVSWSAEGFEPGEVEVIDPGRMLGMRVEIRPKLVGFTYVFGDGTKFGPTTSAGGRYPSGDITHAYQHGGAYATRVQVTWGGDFRVNGGPWTVIPDTVTVEGPPTTVQVKTARAVLVG